MDDDDDFRQNADTEKMTCVSRLDFEFLPPLSFIVEHNITSEFWLSLIMMNTTQHSLPHNWELFKKVNKP